jgi:hypothetical protein
MSPPQDDDENFKNFTEMSQRTSQQKLKGTKL